MNFGLTIEEINTILSENGIQHGKPVSAEDHRMAIAKAILANNEKLRSDIQKLLLNQR